MIPQPPLPPTTTKTCVSGGGGGGLLGVSQPKPYWGIFVLDKIRIQRAKPIIQPLWVGYRICPKGGGVVFPCMQACMILTWQPLTGDCRFLTFPPHTPNKQYPATGLMGSSLETSLGDDFVSQNDDLQGYAAQIPPKGGGTGRSLFEVMLLTPKCTSALINWCPLRGDLPTLMCKTKGSKFHGEFPQSQPAPQHPPDPPGRRC